MATVEYWQRLARRDRRRRSQQAAHLKRLGYAFAGMAWAFSLGVVCGGLA